MTISSDVSLDYLAFKVKTEISRIAPSSRGPIAVSASYVPFPTFPRPKHIPSISFNETERFPMASTVKVAIAAMVLRMIERGDVGKGGSGAGKLITLDLVVDVGRMDLCIEYPEIV